MPSVDEKVVKLSMDDSELDKGTKRAINDLDNLKKALEFKDAERGLEAVSQAAARVDMNPLSNGIANVSNQFNLLNTIASSAIFNVTNKAIDAGERLVKSLSVDQISAGWDKFADKTSAVQTIMASTSNQFSDTGKQMEYVEDQLEKLNWFTDETSYRFLDMVSNIGKFTASNIALDKSVDSMQGIAAWAARSGAGVQGASRAMYNLSQSMAMGAVRLQDWMSIENANMATYEFKETALETAVELGVLTKSADGLYSTLDGTTTTVEGFRESLQKGWFTADVLVNTLDKYGSFASELNKLYEELDGNVPTTTLLKYIDDFVDGSLDMQQAMTATGLSAEELGGWLEKLGSEQYKLGRESFKAAQETKTFQEAIDYVKESVSSGWMRTFEYLFGNYEEAKEFFSNMSEWLYDIFVASGDARNGLLMLWKDDGGRDKFIEGLYQVMDNISTLIETIREAWQDVFPPATVDDLMDLTDGFRRLIDILTPTEDALKTIGNLVRMVATGLSTLKGIVSSFARGLSPYLVLLNRLAGIAMNVVSALAEFSVRLMNLIFPTAKLDEFGNSLQRSSNFITNVLNGGLDTLVDILAALFHAVDTFFTYVEQNGGGVAGVFKALVLAGNDLVENLFNMETVQTMVGGLFSGLGTLFGGLLQAIQDFVGGVMGIDLSADGGVKGWLDGVSKSLEDTNISGKLSAIVAGIGNVIGALLQFVADLMGVDADIRGIIDDLVKDITNIFDWIVEQLSHITLEDVKNVALVILLGEIVFAMKDLLKSLKVGVGELTKVFKQVRGLLDNLGDESITSQLEGVFSKTKWLQITLAIGILVSGLLQLSRVPKDELYQGVVAIVAVLGMVAVALKMVEQMTKKSNGGKTIDNFVKLMSGFGIAIGLIGMAVAKLASVPDGSMLGPAVLSLQVVMGSLIGFAKLMEKVDTGKFAGIAASTTLLAVGITALIPAVAIFGMMDLGQLAKGIGAVGVLMLALGGFGKLMQNTNWASILAVVPLMMSFSAALLVLDGVLASMMGMVMLNASAFQTAATNLMELIMIFGLMNSLMVAATGLTNGSTLAGLALELIAFSAAISVLAGALKTLGEMNPNQFKQGLTAVGGGIAALTASLSILIGIASIAEPAIPVFKALASALMSVAAVIASVGLAAAGIGVAATLISDGFRKMLEIGQEFGDNIPEYVNKAMDGIEVAILRILEIIALSATPMFSAALALFSAIVKAATVIVPDIVDGVMVLATEILSVIGRLAPPLMQALTDLVKGLADNIGPLFNEIDRLLKEIFVHIGISIHNLIKDLGSFVMAIITGEDFSGVISRAFIDETGQAYVDGVPVSMEEAQKVLNDTMDEHGEESAEHYAESTKDKLDEEMPTVAEESLNEFANGVEDNLDIAEVAGNSLGNAFGKGTADSLSSWKKYLDSEGLLSFGLSTTSSSKKEESAYVSPRLQKTLDRRKKWEEQQKQQAYDTGYDLGDSAGSGIGAGLASSKAPAAAARSQAQNVGSAFTDEIKKLDLADKTANSLLSLWKAQNPNASEAEIAAKEMGLVADQIVTQSKRAEIAQIEYTDTLKTMGSTATETSEAYIKMIDEQTKLIELQNKLTDAQVQGHTSSAEAFQKMTDILHDYYYTENNGRTMADFLRSLGFTDQEIAESAAQEAGYAIPRMVEETKAATLEATETAGQQTVQLYAQSVTSNLESLLPEFQSMGNNYADTLGYGIVENTENVSQSAVDVVNTTLANSETQDIIQKWNDVGYHFMTGMVAGIVRGSPEVEAAIAAAVRRAIAAAKAAAGVASPSKETMWQAEMWMEGYTRGIENNANIVIDSLVDTVSQSLEKAKSSMKSGSAIGEETANSILYGMTNAIDTFGQNAAQVVSATTDDIENMFTPDNLDEYSKFVNGLFDQIGDDNTITYNLDIQMTDESKRILSQLTGVDGKTVAYSELTNATQRMSLFDSDIASRQLKQLQNMAQMENARNAQPVSSPAPTTSTPIVNNFTQNNYSPKALSRLEIRRDTERLVNAIRK